MRLVEGGRKGGGESDLRKGEVDVEKKKKGKSVRASRCEGRGREERE